MTRLALLSLSLLSAAACGDARTTTGATPDAGTPIDASTTPPPPITVVLTPPVGLAVVSNDSSFASSSVSLLDSTGNVVKGDCFSSATKAPGVTSALSGDVVLGSWAQFNNEVAVIDRTNGVITWLDPTSCAPLRQLDVSTGFLANPHDVIAVASNKAYVTRYEINKAPGKKEFDGGDDLLIIDPTKPAITGRIALSSYAVQVNGTTIQARPDRARLIDGKLYVALGDIGPGFSVVSHGRIVVIDVQTDKVLGAVDFPDALNNCTNLSYLDDKHLLDVTCNGQFVFGGPIANQTAESAVVTVDLSQSPPAVSHTQPASAFNAPISAYSGIARDGALGFAVIAGDGQTTSDQLFTLDTAAGTSAALKTTTDSFVYGNVLVDPAQQHAFLTDATAKAPGLLVFSYGATGAPTLTTTINASPTAKLLPRELQWR
jgi:hypothetical protein